MSEIALAAADLALVERLRAERDAAIADISALYETIRDALACGCRGVHWVDTFGEPEAEACNLWIDLDDQLRAVEAGGHPGARLMAERDRYAADLHTRNGELLVERMNLDMLRDDVKRAIALLPANPGAALGGLVSAMHAQIAPQAAQDDSTARET